jgi:hypothetical protein
VAFVPISARRSTGYGLCGGLLAACDEVRVLATSREQARFTVGF